MYHQTVFTFTHYEDTKDDAECRKKGGLSLPTTVRHSTYDFLFDFSRKYASISYRF